jgi:3(or 17)beta-hydroxysteroid dehydrogenase
VRANNKICIVTGGTGSMGSTIVARLLAEGAKVVVSDLEPAKSPSAGSTPQNCLFHRSDVTKEEDWQALIARTIEVFGRIDVLVNNAGISGTGADATSLSDWYKIITVNASSVFLGIKHGAEAMIATGGGSIVNISSISAISGILGVSTGTHSAYHASKAAVASQSRFAACRFGPKGVRVNTIFPGFFPPMRGSKVGPLLEQRIADTPLRRLGQTSDIANAVLFLASDESSFVSAAELVVDGGYMARD